MFDGSSVAGWKGINESDMVMMPDASSAVLDPFTEDATLNVRCDILEPATMQGYDRDPRSIAKRAEDYMRSTGIADTVLVGPEPEFFLFDDVKFSNDMSGSFFKIDDVEAAWNTGSDIEAVTKVTVLALKVVTSQLLQLTHLKTFALQCVSSWKKWA